MSGWQVKVPHCFWQTMAELRPKYFRPPQHPRGVKGPWVGRMEKARRFRLAFRFHVAPPARLERTTFRLGGGPSILVRYGGLSATARL